MVDVVGQHRVAQSDPSVKAMRSSAQGSASTARVQRQANGASMTVRSSDTPTTPCRRSAHITGAIRRFTSSAKLAVPSTIGRIAGRPLP